MLSTVLTPVTPQNAPSHSSTHNELAHAHNTFFGGDYTLAKFSMYGPSAAVFGPDSGSGYAWPAVDGTRGIFVDGSAGSPAASGSSPSVFISRIGKATTFNESGALIVQVENLTGGTTQPVGAAFHLRQNANFDAVSLSSEIMHYGNTGAGFAIFSFAQAFTLGGSAMAWESETRNMTGVDAPWPAGGGGSGIFWGLDVAMAGLGNLTTAAYLARGFVDVAFGIPALAQVGCTAAFRDDGSAATSLQITGPKTNGIDTTSATITNRGAILKTASDAQLDLIASGAHNAAVNVIAPLTQAGLVNFYRTTGALITYIEMDGVGDMQFVDATGGFAMLRLDVGWTPTANQTPIYMSEGVTPTSRQVQWKAGNTLGAGDKVMVLV